MHNEAYSGRPDDRPWSERHNAVLWLAMILAVAVLAALAIRGLSGSRKTVILSGVRIRFAKFVRSRRTPTVNVHMPDRDPSTASRLSQAKCFAQDDRGHVRFRFQRMDSSTSEIHSGRFSTSRGLGPSAAPTMPSRSIRSIKWAARP